MKKLISFLTTMGFVLAFGTAYGSEADSLINTLDPSKVPGYVELETGAVTLPAATTPVLEQGSAAGGRNREPDTFLNYIDPSKVAGYVELETGVVSTGSQAFTVKGSAAGGMSMVSDTFLNYIDPSRLPGYVNLETGN